MMKKYTELDDDERLRMADGVFQILMDLGWRVMEGERDSWFVLDEENFRICDFDFRDPFSAVLETKWWMDAHKNEYESRRHEQWKRRRR